MRRACGNIYLASRSIVVEHISASCGRCCRLAIYCRKAVAIIECTISNRRYAIGDSHTCKVARPECINSNRRYAISDSHTCNAAAPRECTISNRCYAIANSHTCKAVANIVFTTDYYSIFYR